MFFLLSVNYALVTLMIGLAPLSAAADVPSPADLKQLLAASRNLLAQNNPFFAGDHYPEVWARDMNTFLDIAMDVVNQSTVRLAVLRFLQFQHANGEISDGYVLSNNTVQLFKNTCETDQESSLILALVQYVRRYNDQTVFDDLIGNQTVVQRVDSAVEFLLTSRFDSEHGLLWGGTTVDWGDVQPESGFNQTTIVNITSLSHPAIDIYDNALFIEALTEWAALIADSQPALAQRYRSLAANLTKNARAVLWDAERDQWRPHVYLARGSPFPSWLDEADVYFHGGTAVSIEAGLLNGTEIVAALTRMQRNAALAGPAVTIGLTLYPPYPNGTFLTHINDEWWYQNGGDWDWFGGRMLQALIRSGFIAEALVAMQPVVQRVAKFGFWEFFDRYGQPQGSPDYHGAAGVLGRAAKMLLQAKGVLH